MKFVIPVKGNSTRVPNKNFKPFIGVRSLFDITLNKLLMLKNVKSDDIFVSCDDISVSKRAAAAGINFILRDSALCDNDAPSYKFYNGIVKDVPGDDDIGWCQVIDPMFNEYQECLDIWSKVKDNYDSLAVVYPIQKYLLDGNHKPLGFGFGANHVKSQNLPFHYELAFSFSIQTRKTIEKHGYHFGESPYWFHANGAPIDIDTLEDFDCAAAFYKAKYEPNVAS